MASPPVLRAVQQSLDWLERGRITEQEATQRLGFVFSNNDIDGIFDATSPEHHPLLHAAHLASLQRIADEECLQPEASPFDDISREYHARVAEFLLKPAPGEPRLPEFTAVCLPSFQPESAVRLVRSNKGLRAVREPSLVLVNANEAIWGSTAPSIETTHHTRGIPDGLATRLETLWERMLLSTRASRHVGMGLDGVTYHFTFRHKSGQTWSPRPETRAGRFVEVARTLARYIAAEESTRSAIEGELLAQLEWFKV